MFTLPSPPPPVCIYESAEVSIGFSQWAPKMMDKLGIDYQCHWLKFLGVGIDKFQILAHQITKAYLN
jgi:hypothetical protein